jgi:hypothetical protein
MRPGMPLVSPGAGRIPPVPLQQPQNLFRFGEQSIYSTQLFVPGAIASTTNRMFTVPIGSTGQGFTNALTIAETNLKEGGRVPSGVAYDVYGVACQILQSSAAADAGTFSVAQDTQALIANLINIQNNGVLSWDFTQTVVDICPVSLAGAGGGAFGAVAQNAAGANSGAMNNGNGGIWMYKKYPVALPGNSTFSIVVRFGSRAAAIAGQSVGVRVVLLGYYKNVIEIG